jgi:hypothetical protein
MTAWSFGSWGTAVITDSRFIRIHAFSATWIGR